MPACAASAHGRARTHRLLGCRLSPLGLPVSRHASGPPNGRGRHKMAAAANSGSSLPLFDCPTWWVAGKPGLELPGLSWPGLAGRLIFRSERNASETLGLIEGELSVGPAACGGTGSLSPGPGTEETQSWGALKRLLRLPHRHSAACWGASGRGPELTPTPDWMPGALVEHRTCPPSLCPERARASFPALAEPQRPASLCFAPSWSRTCLSFA